MTDAALAAELAAEAGELLLAVREEMGFGHPWALGDAGDSLANELILRRLRDERPGDAVLSEEAFDDLARLRHDRVWIIDPLDGTREFSTQGRDDWAVHIALWQRSAGDLPGTQTGTSREITDAAVSLPAQPHSTVRSLFSTCRHTPWSTPYTRPSTPDRMWPPLRSALLTSTSNTAIRRSWASSACIRTTSSPVWS